MSVYQITVTDSKGNKELIRVHAFSYLEAMIVAEEQYEVSLEKKSKKGDIKDV